MSNRDKPEIRAGLDIVRSKELKVLAVDYKLILKIRTTLLHKYMITPFNLQQVQVFRKQQEMITKAYPHYFNVNGYSYRVNDTIW